MKDFVKQRGIDFFDRSCIAAACIVYQAVDTTVVSMHSAYGFPHSIKLRYVDRDRQAARKLLRQFLERFSAASEQGDFRTAIRQSDCRRQPNSRRGAGDNEYAIFDLHLSFSS